MSASPAQDRHLDAIGNVAEKSVDPLQQLVAYGVAFFRPVHCEDRNVALDIDVEHGFSRHSRTIVRLLPK